MGWPKKELRFLPGKRFERPRAGMMAAGLTELFKEHPLPFLRRRTSGQSNP